MFGQNPYSNNISVLDELKGFIYKKDVLSRLILINISVFLLINVVALFQFLMGLDRDFILSTGVNRITYYLSLPSDLSTLLMRPWGIFTYMFVQENILHLVFNLILLYVGGRIFNQFVGKNKLLSTYIISGIAGALLYILTFNIFPAFGQIVNVSFAIGASASVLGIFIAAATYVPNLAVNVVFLGNVKLKYIAIVFLAIDLINIRSGNAGGHIAHIGGALYGFTFVNQLKKNNDISLYFTGFLKTIKSFFTQKKKSTNPFKSVHKNTNRRPVSDDEYLKNKNARQAEIDKILDKIKKSGYESLSSSEKQKLFQASKD